MEYLLLVLKTEISKPNAAELNNNIKIGSKCTFFTVLTLVQFDFDHVVSEVEMHPMIRC